MYFDILPNLPQPATKKHFHDSATIMPHSGKVLLMKTQLKMILHLTDYKTSDAIELI